MRKLLLSSVFALVPFMAFAGGPERPSLPQGVALSGSAAAVGSIQGTQANAMVGGNGAVIAGAVSGNYTDVTTTGHASATPAGVANTKATATQTNIGGTLAGGFAQTGKGFYGKPTGVATGSASGMQTSGDLGGSIAIAGSQKAVQKTGNGKPSVD